MRKTKATTKPDTLTWDTVCELALALPGVEEGTSYGTPALKIKGKLFARLKEDGVTVVLKLDQFKREILLQAEPETFFITDHYRAYPWILVRLSAVRRATLRELLEQAWRLTAPARLIAAYEKAEKR